MEHERGAPTDFEERNGSRDFVFPGYDERKATVEIPEALGKLLDRVSSGADPKGRYLNIVQLGREMKEPPRESDVYLRSNRVRGCTSTVHVCVGVRKKHTVEGEERSTQMVLELQGYADAMVSRGFVALLVEGLHGADVQDVLRLNARDIADRAGLDFALFPSRAGGLARILRTIQERARMHMGEPVDIGEYTGDTSTVTASTRDNMRWTSVQPEKVAVLLSGGVDSSVAMRLVMDKGFRPQPFYLKIWLDDELAHLGDCPWEEDIEYATAVCDQAGVELETVPLQREYWDRVVAYTIAEARRGRTPNPDVMCNSRIKFGAFYDSVGSAFSKVVTGHYAQTRLDPMNGRTELIVSADSRKDQTYFLAQLGQAQLASAEFPVGEFTKDHIRELALGYNLPNKARKDSQGICFLGKLKFDDFLEHHLGTMRGELVEFETGTTLGTHRGFWFYTSGQRKGLGLSGGPWHVVAKDPSENVVYVSRDYNGSDMTRDEFSFDSVAWISGDWPPGLALVGMSYPLVVKTRHGPRQLDCVVTRTGDDTGRVALCERDKGLAPGQFAVFYHGSVCLGTGVISSTDELERAAPRTGSTVGVKLQAHYD